MDSAQAAVKEEQKEPAGATSAIFDSPERFINRELSWLHFNRRVLGRVGQSEPSGAGTGPVPVYSANNLDEFFMVRVAGLKAQVREGITERSPDGSTPTEQLVQINETVSKLASDQQAIWRDLRHILSEVGIVLVDGKDVTKAEGAWIEDPLSAQHLPAADAAGDRSGASVSVHPEPRLHHRAASGARVRRQGDERADPHAGARSTASSVCLLGKDGSVRLVTLEQATGLFIGRLFPGYTVKGRRVPHHPRLRTGNRGRSRGSRPPVRVGIEAPPPRFGDPSRNRSHHAGRSARLRAARALKRRTTT